MRDRNAFYDTAKDSFPECFSAHSSPLAREYRGRGRNVKVTKVKTALIARGEQMAAKRPSYKLLWGKYEEFRSDPHPIAGVSAQCAVRMSMTLMAVGLYSASRFWSVIPKGATV